MELCPWNSALHQSPGFCAVCCLVAEQKQKKSLEVPQPSFLLSLLREVKFSTPLLLLAHLWENFEPKSCRGLGAERGHFSPIFCCRVGTLLPERARAVGSQASSSSVSEGWGLKHEPRPLCKTLAGHGLWKTRSLS